MLFSGVSGEINDPALSCPPAEIFYNLVVGCNILQGGALC